ncbi:MAG: hypothetical protein OHK0046_07770 [Anaerolineae bacterium]
MLLAGLVVVGMFNLLRAIEQWLQQHIFKVGWLLTKNFQTTTILYYTFFLPGILLYEVVYWLAAGLLDVRAERAFSWPEKQEIGQLKLNFVKLSKKASPAKVTLINTAPLLVGLVIIWFIATSIMNIPAVLETLTSGTRNSLGIALNQLFGAADFTLWAYLLFTISNTMIPDTTFLRNWRWLALAAVVFFIPLFLLGVGNDILGEALNGPISGAMNALSLIFGLMIFIDVLVLALLGGIESMVERITGDSATFQNGKMVVMTRKEAMELRRQEREKARTSRSQPASRPALVAGPPSIYAIALPIPGPPGKEPITSVSTIVDTGEPPAALPEQRPRRIEPDVIPSTATPVRPAPPPQSDTTEAASPESQDETEDSA